MSGSAERAKQILYDSTIDLQLARATIVGSRLKVEDALAKVEMVDTGSTTRLLRDAMVSMMNINEGLDNMLATLNEVEGQINERRSLL